MTTEGSKVGVLVSIGRNVGKVPMPLQRWHEYKGEVFAAVVAARGWRGDTYMGTTEGRALWGDVWEDTEAVSMSGLGDACALREELTYELATIARKYEQEAVYLLVGEASFPGLSTSGGAA